MADNGETRPDEEVLKRRFEYFKHMTTVSTATKVAVIAVYGSTRKAMHTGALYGAGFLGLPRGASDKLALVVPIIAVCGFFVSLVASLWGLYLVAESRSVHENSAAISRMLVWSMVSFILGAGAAAVVGAFLLEACLTVIMLLIPTLVAGALLILKLIRKLVQVFPGGEPIVLVDRNGPLGARERDVNPGRGPSERRYALFPHTYRAPQYVARARPSAKASPR